MAREWGQQQALLYSDAINATIAKIVEYPQVGAPRRWRGTIYRQSRSEAHRIVYRVHGSDIHIIRILHERMDASRHLP